MRIAACLLAAAFTLSGCQGVRDSLSGPQPNPGPCPNALSLYDAYRVVNFAGEEIVHRNVGFTGEILNVVSNCTYSGRSASPIDMEMAMRLAFGRGPAAAGDSHTYDMFITVVRLDPQRNVTGVIHRETFQVTARFPSGRDRVELVEEFPSIRIPRADETTSGSNFEVLVGFDLTDEQLEFNRSGIRFRVTAGQD
ncbi:hypothetical protein F1654_04930 [Alkalicaulis satelles]|uniref:Uncharacterized protein n=1 Tax=Alkalicaulis satelles TaxID=2609175 RepID=A0A5M6ZN38_9PROT|nr:hypothetical protein [Alkalicaulis satelles]KAA5805325.1 hypothetical protein F1654_04930 [Alkalicaulis satelles]